MFDIDHDKPFGFLTAGYIRDGVFGDPNPYELWIDVYSTREHSLGLILSGVLGRDQFRDLVSRSRLPVYIEVFQR